MKFLYEKDNIIYAKCTNCDRVLKFKRFDLEEVKTGVECFCGNISYNIDGMPEEEKNSGNNNESKHSESKTFVPNASVQTPTYMSAFAKMGPICPTCGSRNVSKISLTSKAIGGAMFGVFSSNIRNTFKCNNCGYKW